MSSLPQLDFQSLQSSIQTSLVATTRSANRLASEDLQFQRTVNPSTADRIDEQSERLLGLASDLLKSAGQTSDGDNAAGSGYGASRNKSQASAAAAAAAVGTLEDAEDVDMRWRGILDSIDALLEKADTCLDEYTGLLKRKDHPVVESAPKPKKPKTFERLDNKLRHANILKPQLAFEHKADNFAPAPWKPILTSKPHAVVPLDESFGTLLDDYQATQYQHPYDYEIRELQYPSHVYEKKDPIRFHPIETTTATWVDTWEGVLEMLEELKQAKEIAVDLEHHDFRTYGGLLSLMQISTRDKDWIVDTLKPWRHKLEILNQVFADSEILKVFHGAYMDMVWLQRDLGLYVVGLFDTYHACVNLGYPGRGLAYLLGRFADFEADKKYQMADWRIRPLPEEMFYYARSDTHYLLYVYDNLRNELADRSEIDIPENNLIENVLQSSKDVALSRHEANTYDTETGHGNRGWFNTLVKMPSALNGEQFAVFRALHKWRDDTARREDESTMFIMPQQTLMEVSKLIPSDPKALWSLLYTSSQHAKSALDELFRLIQEAKETGANGPRSLDFFSGNNTMGSVAQQLRDESKQQQQQQQQQQQTTSMADVNDLRTQTSQLWGDIPPSSTWDGATPAPTKAEGVESRVALPWTKYIRDALPQATAGNGTVPETEAEDVDMIPVVGPPTTTQLENMVTRPAQTQSDGDTEFTLKQGRKRKAEADNVDVVVKEDTSSESSFSSSSDSSDDDATDSSSSDEDGETVGGAPIAQPPSPTTTTTTIMKGNVTKGQTLSGADTQEVISLDDDDNDAFNTAKSNSKSRKNKLKRQQKEERKASDAAKYAIRMQKKEKNNNKHKNGNHPSSSTSTTTKTTKATAGYEKPFDYSQARSVLHAERAGMGGINGNNGVRGPGQHPPPPQQQQAQQRYDPYGSRMNADGPKPARRPQGEKAGKSATFRK